MEQAGAFRLLSALSLNPADFDSDAGRDREGPVPGALLRGAARLDAGSATSGLITRLATQLAIGHVNALLVHRFPLPSHNDSFFAPGKVSRGLRYPLFPLPAERGYTDDDFETALTVLESETILRSGQRSQVAWDIRKYLKGGRRSQSWSEQRPEDRVHVTQNLFRVHLCALVGLSMVGCALRSSSRVLLTPRCPRSGDSPRSRVSTKLFRRCAHFQLCWASTVIS